MPDEAGTLETLRAAVNQLEDAEFHRLFGPWQSWAPAEVAARFAGAPFRWWIVGGWSLDAGPEPRREHEDTDVAVLADDLTLVREWLHDFHLWETRNATLRPLMPGLPMTLDCEQLWVRRDAMSPWVMDLLMTPTVAGQWVYKRDHRMRLPFDDVVETSPDGVPYQRPEITLLFKAHLARAKDEDDFAAVLPSLAPRARTWLRAALELSEPGHPWIERLED